MPEINVKIVSLRRPCFVISSSQEQVAVGTSKNVISAFS